MKIKKFNTLHQLIFLKHLFTVNCYIIENETNLILIDTGFEYCGENIIKYVQKLKKPLAYILITHPHDDHVGALDKIKFFFPDALVGISKRDALLMNGDFSLYYDEKRQIKGTFIKNMKTKPDLLLEDRQEIENITAILTPGHTPGSMCYLDGKTKFLVVGDALQVEGGVAIAGDFRLRFPFPALATWDFEKAVKSFEMVNKMNCKMIASGHGKILLNPKNKICNAIRKANKKIREGKNEKGNIKRTNN